MTDHDTDSDLWNRRGEPDPELRALEDALRPHRWRGELPELRRAAPSPDPRRALAAAVVLLAVGAMLWQTAFRGPPRYAAEWRGPAGVVRAASLRPGARVETSAEHSARLDLGAIGRVELLPRGRLRVASAAELGASDAEHLLHLERGVLRATIFAAPRVFQVGTPGGLAVDMGCIYTTEVLPDGLTRLRVETGQVSFETPARQVTVPSGASLTARPGAGPGTPAWDDADPELRALFARVDRGAPHAGDLAALLARDDPRLSLSVAHLLDVAPEPWRAPLVARLAGWEPPPDARLPERVIAGDEAALERWKRAMSWWW